KLKERYEAKEQLIGPAQMRHHERVIMLSVIDQLWKDHLLNMDHLKEGIGLRGYGQHDPLVEYKRESFDMFEGMMNTFKEQTVRYLYLMQIIDAATNMPVEIPRRKKPENVIESGPATSAEPAPQPGNGHQPPPPPGRRPQTSLDDM